MVIVEDRRRHANVVNLDMATPVEVPPVDGGRRLYSIMKCMFSYSSLDCAIV